MKNLKRKKNQRQELEKEGRTDMFIKINDSCIVNTDNIIWIDVNNEKMVVKMSDDSEHATNSNQLNQFLEIINNKNFERK